MRIFLFSFKMAIKTAGSAQKIRVGRDSRNTAFFRPNQMVGQKIRSFLEAQTTTKFFTVWVTRQVCSERRIPFESMSC